MKPISVYVHIPFCTVKCGYCDFNAYAGMDALKGDYTAAVVRELSGYAAVLRERRVVSVGFGGGTPGEMAPSQIAAIVDAVRSVAALDPGAEVSMEANPGTSTLEQLAGFRRAGVTRISFGVQSFDAAELAFLDRIHSPEAAAVSVPLARAAGFESVGIDLIYGLPGQEVAQWRRSLECAIALGPDHISAYALTVEEGTTLGRRVREGEIAAPDPDTAAGMYDLASDLLAAAGYRQYEVSNWARPGHESRHNQVYWTDGDYLGIGAGAHGYLDGERYENIAHPRAYVAAVASAPDISARPAVANRYRPSPAMAMADWFMLALRRMEGFAPAAFEAKFGVPVDAVLGRTLADCEAAGVIERDDHIRLSHRGRLLHGEVTARAMAELGAAG
ncbi:MAG: radical SAM family heme chaperone HemW [Chloroflexi bacterium]|nr:radical SAM family heme chaperone HemW [Chloroflexota bacterium]